MGRCANRIAKGRFELAEESGERRVYQLATNMAPNHLHGGAFSYTAMPQVREGSRHIQRRDRLYDRFAGERGFDKVTWRAEREQHDGGGESVRLTYTSSDGEEVSDKPAAKQGNFSVVHGQVQQALISPVPWVG